MANVPQAAWHGRIQPSLTGLASSFHIFPALAPQRAGRASVLRTGLFSDAAGAATGRISWLPGMPQGAKRASMLRTGLFSCAAGAASHQGG